MVKRDQARTHGQLLRSELNETVDHALRAAGHAAGGVDAMVRPRVEAARERVAPTADKVRASASRQWGSTRAALGPLSEAAQAKVKDAKAAGRKRGRKPSRRRWPLIAGLVAAGAVVGAIGAMVLRQRQQSWEDLQAAELQAEEELLAEGSGAGVTPGGTSRPEGMPRPDGAANQRSPEAAARHN